MELITRVFTEVLYLGAMASVIVVLILALKKIFKKTLSPKWHYYLWVVLILRLILPFQPPSDLSIYNVFNKAASTLNLPTLSIVAPIQNPADGHEVAGNPAGSGGQTQNSTTGGLVSGTGTTGNLSPNNVQASQAGGGNAGILSATAVVWLAGMSVLGLYTIVINAAFAGHVRRRYVPLRNERILRILGSCKKALHIEREISLITSDKPRTPSLYGLLRPKIIVYEASLEKLDDDEIRHIFLHELSHNKRKDIAVFWILTVLQIIYFFNPLIWYAFHKIREDIEIACDADVLKYLRPEEHQAYGSTIIKLIRMFSKKGFIPVTAGLSRNKSSVKRRIQMIGNYKKRKWTGALLALILIVTVAVAGLTGCSTTSNTPPSSSPTGSPTAESPSPDASVEPSDSTPETSAPVETPTISPTPSETPMPTAAPQPSENPSNPSPVPTAVTQKGYYGKWTVSSVLAFGGAGTYSKEQAEKLIGISLSFDAETAMIINDQPSGKATALKNPVYQESVISKADFLTNFKMSFDKLGISGDSIAEVNVSSVDAGGCVLLIKDSSTMILAAGGTYFELTRA